MKILITGASGLLGKKVFSYFNKRDFLIIGTCHENISNPKILRLDLADNDGINVFLEKHKPQVIIHTAALTDVVLSERNPYRAKLINADSAVTIARWCNSNAAHLVYISSDYVFDGEHGPYNESSEPYPVQIYGFTKMLGESALTENSNTAVVRVAILHGYNDKNDKPVLTTEVIKSLESGKQLVLDSKRIKYPTLIDDVAGGIGYIVENKLSGIFHVAGDEGVTRYEWALKVAKIFNLKSSLLVADPNKDSNASPQRPKDVRLVNTRLKHEINDIDSSILIIKNQIEEMKEL